MINTCPFKAYGL